MTPTFADLSAAVRADPPRAAVVLGSGLGPVAERLSPLVSVPFAAVPGLPAAAVVGHKGRLTLGVWAGRRVLVFEGRVHFYEGHSWDTVVAPVRAAAALGVRSLLLTNAAGGIRDDLAPGSLMLLTGHLDLTHRDGWRRPGPKTPYDERLRRLLAEEAGRRGVALKEGVYAMLTGPCYETPAEIRVLRAMGADAVGMSTGREAEEAHALGLRCVAVSCVTNRAAGLGDGPLSHEEVLTTAKAAGEQLADVVEVFLSC